jgi:hypothetical protein
MTEQNKQPPAEAGAGAVAWVWEWYGSRYDDAECWNTTIEASKPADWELNNSEFPIRNLRPLYTSQTTATQAAVAAAMRGCADILEEWAKLAMEYGFDGDAEEFRNIKGEILERIPAEANAALGEYVQEKCLEVANEMNTIKSIVDDDSIYSIVTSVIEKGK